MRCVLARAIALHPAGRHASNHEVWEWFKVSGAEVVLRPDAVTGPILFLDEFVARPLIPSWVLARHTKRSKTKKDGSSSRTASIGMLLVRGLCCWCRSR